VKPAQISGLAESSDVRWLNTDAKTSTHLPTLNSRLTNAIDKKSAGRNPGKSKSDRRQSDDRERSKDVVFTDADSPFHLWFTVEVRIDAAYESAGHYLVTKSLGIASLL